MHLISISKPHPNIQFYEFTLKLIVTLKAFLLSSLSTSFELEQQDPESLHSLTQPSLCTAFFASVKFPCNTDDSSISAHTARLPLPKMNIINHPQKMKIPDIQIQLSSCRLRPDFHWENFFARSKFFFCLWAWDENVLSVNAGNENDNKMLGFELNWST